MVIVDTSIWVTHLRQGSRQLEKLLMDAEVMCHPFIIGELACGNLKNRNEIISLLQSLPMAPTIDFDEFLFFIRRNRKCPPDILLPASLDTFQHFILISCA